MREKTMNELINKTVAMRRLKAAYDGSVAVHGDNDNLFADGIDYAMDIIGHIKAVDAVPVIRCKDCKHWSDNDGIYTAADGVHFARCRIHNYETLNGLHEGWCPTENCYCSLGERKENINGDKNN